MRATETPIAFEALGLRDRQERLHRRLPALEARRGDLLRRRRRRRAPAPREQGPDARGGGRHAHVARSPARRLRRPLGGPPPDPRHARARRPELPPDRRAARHEPAVGGVHPLPRRRRLSEEYEELVSGERCRRIQAIIAGSAGGRAGTRDPNHRNIFTEINTPTRIFEYLALAKPVIAPRTKGIRDYFGDDELIFFDVGNADDLARKIEFAFFHPTEVAETVKRGQAVYLSHTWSRERLTLVNSIGELLHPGTLTL